MADGLRTFQARCRLLFELALGLESCHKRGVVHRDVKPSNVLIAPDGRPRWIDFGLAHLESAAESETGITQELVGTPAYLAPEQVELGRTGRDPASDQFSLGVLAYELLTLQRPFAHATRTATLDAIGRADPTPPRRHAPDLPHDVERIVMHALERERSRRYPDLAAMAEDLRAVLELRAISLLPPTPWEMLRSWSRRRRRGLVQLGAALIVALLVGTFTWQRSESARARELSSELDRLESLGLQADSPAMFMRLFSDLSATGDQVEAFAREAFFFGEALDESRLAQLARTHQHLHAAIEAERDRAKLLGSRHTIVPWKGVLELQGRLSPGEPLNAEDRQRGSVVLAPELEGARLVVARWQPIRGFVGLALLDEIFVTRPFPGLHRVTALDPVTGAVLLDGDFEFDLDAARRTLSVGRVDSRWKARMVRVEFDLDAIMHWMELGSVPGEGIACPPEDFQPTLEFEITRDPIAWRELLDWAAFDPEFAAVIEMERQSISRHISSECADPAAPACTSPDSAWRFAAAQGMRLPTLFEIAQADALGLLTPSKSSARITGYLTSTPVSTSADDMAVYDGLMLQQAVSANRGDGGEWWLRSSRRESCRYRSPSVGSNENQPICTAGFRLARSIRVRSSPGFR